MENQLKTHPFVLVDPLAVFNLPEGLTPCPLIPQGLKEEAHLFPVLFDLSTADEEQLGQFIEWIDEHVAQYEIQPIAALLATESSLAALQAHLSHWLLMTLADKQRYLLRYYDPRVFIHLFWILNHRDFASFFAPLTAWCFWYQGKWRNIPLPLQGDMTKQMTEQKQLQHLLRIRSINQLLARMPAGLPLIDYQRQAWKISGYIERAQKYGWQHQEDWVCFATLCLQHHPKIDSHPAMQRVIGSLEQREVSFTDAIAILKPGTLEFITHALQSTENTHRDHS